MTRGEAADGVPLTFDRGERKTAARLSSAVKLGNPLRCPLALIEQNVTGLRSPTTEEELWRESRGGWVRVGGEKKCFSNCAHLFSLTAAAAAAASLPSG